jgi:hypothetical protein
MFSKEYRTYWKMDNTPVDLLAFEKQLQGRRLFSRQLFQDRLKLAEQAKQSHQPLTAPNIYGNPRVVYEPTRKTGKSDIGFAYKTYCQLSPDFPGNKTECELPSNFSGRSITPIILHDNEILPDPGYKWRSKQFWEACRADLEFKWLTSTHCKLLHQSIASLASRSVPIKKIVCFGLGSAYGHNKKTTELSKIANTC